MTFSEVDTDLPSGFRETIEQRYYARINAQAELNQIAHDPFFMQDPGHHVALWPDHGVVHVRDVANQILTILENINGLLIPKRSPERLAFMRAYGTLAAHIHDIGMVDFSPFGRTMHPEFSTQAVLGREFDDLMECFETSPANLVLSRLKGLESQGSIQQPASIVLREMLSMTNCHSKSKVSMGILNDPTKLKALMQKVARTDLHRLYYEQRVEKSRQALNTAKAAKAEEAEINRLVETLEDAEQSLILVSNRVGGFEQGFVSSSEQYTFDWLISSDIEVQALAEDVIDTLRALRCADSLRQRGTVLKTSGRYEVFIDRQTANGVYALRWGNNQLFLLESADPLASGEANIASSELNQVGELRISFHRGAYASGEIIHKAARNTALAVSDIIIDSIESFQRLNFYSRDGSSDLLPAGEVTILFEETEDNLEFAELVRQQVLKLNPSLDNPIECVASLQSASLPEVQRYLEGRLVDWDPSARLGFIQRVEVSGQKLVGMDLKEAFRETRLVDVCTGDTLIEAGSAASFVYIPMGEGLKVIPMGGYEAFDVQPWMPLGNTGVIRGAGRNATVTSSRNVELLMIPKSTYLKHWYHPYRPEEFRDLLRNELIRIEN